jgi:hypothetical protein
VTYWTQPYPQSSEHLAAVQERLRGVAAVERTKREAVLAEAARVAVESAAKKWGSARVQPTETLYDIVSIPYSRP